jgi:phosphate-selective porin OprO and OprP
VRFLNLAAATLLILLLYPVTATAQGVPGESTIAIGGWLQPRYEYSIRHGEENLSSFYMRRVRLDVRGQVIWPALTYRVMPELARTANLRDAWLNYAFSPAAQVRIGQFTVPFQWHRYIGAGRQHFAERGVPAETFGFPTGRDIGIMLHGQNPAGTLAYSLGIFDGLGRNTAVSNSDGHMASARLTWAAIGPLPREESDLARRDEPGLSFGLGIQGANKNEARAWDIGRSASTNRRADYVAGTADVSLRWMGFSLAADGYLRQVSPDDPAVDTYDGWGFMLSSGYFIMPQRLELVARYSELRIDSDAPETRGREIGAGLNIYHRGHDVKTRVQFLTNVAGVDPPAGFGRDGIFLVEFHIQF